jgi:hypothetical protein
MVLQLSASTRALGLGNSFALGFRDPDAIFYQPGDLLGSQGFSGSIQRYGPPSTLTTLAATRGWLSGTVALGFQHLSYGSDDNVFFPADAPSNPAPADPGSLRENGRSAVSELVVSLGYARSLFGLRVGGVGKFMEQRFGAYKASVGAVDLGVSASPGPLTLGLAVRNMGPKLEMGGGETPLPLSVDLGASTDMAWVGPLDVSASGAINYREGGDVVPSLGVEVAYWPVTGRTFIGRVGFRHLPEPETGNPLTFGFGFAGDDVILDYAYEGFESGDPTHRITLGWR